MRVSVKLFFNQVEFLAFQEKTLKILYRKYRARRNIPCYRLEEATGHKGYGVASFEKQGTCDVKVIQSTTAVMTILHTGCAIFLRPRWVFGKADGRPGSNFVYWVSIKSFTPHLTLEHIK